MHAALQLCCGELFFCHMSYQLKNVEDNFDFSANEMDAVLSMHDVIMLLLLIMWRYNGVYWGIFATSDKFCWCYQVQIIDMIKSLYKVSL